MRIFRNSFGRKKLLWIIVGISIVFIIAAIVIPTTIVLKRKGNVSTRTAVTIEITTTMKTAEVASTMKTAEVASTMEIGV
jgi:flagellar basal body-associated protein FliL